MLKDKDPVYVNPASVNHIATTFKPGEDPVTLAGDWDVRCKTFKEGTEFMRAYEHVLSGGKWCDTEYYTVTLERLSSGHKTWRNGCRNEADLIARCKKLDIWFADMRDNGWRQLPGEDYVTISVDRKGRYLFNDGQHRLGMAKLLGINRIPVKVVAWHSGWVKRRAPIAAYAAKHNGFYTEVDHVDFQNVNVHNKGRAGAIVGNIPAGCTTVLDIGAHWGHFCSKLTQAGHKCTGVELSASNCRIATILRDSEDLDYTILGTDIFSYLNKSRSFDVVLALNVFHHFLKNSRGYNKLVGILGNMDMKCMFLGVHSPTEKPMRTAYRNLAYDEFADFVVKNSCLNSYRVLPHGRKLYLIS